AADDRVIAMERELGFEGCKRYGLEAQIGAKGETISTRLFHGSASAGELPPGDGAARRRRERIARFHLVARSRRIRSVAIVLGVERFARGGISSRSRSFPCDVGPVESVSRGDAEVERHGLAARCARLALQTSKPLGRKLRHAQPAREPLVELRATKRPRRIEAPCERLAEAQAISPDVGCDAVEIDAGESQRNRRMRDAERGRVVPQEPDGFEDPLEAILGRGERADVERELLRVELPDDRDARNERYERARKKRRFEDASVSLERMRAKREDIDDDRTRDPERRAREHGAP